MGGLVLVCLHVRQINDFILFIVYISIFCKDNKSCIIMFYHDKECTCMYDVKKCKIRAATYTIFAKVKRVQAVCRVCRVGKVSF